MAYADIIERKLKTLDRFAVKFCTIIFHIILFSCIVNELGIFVIDKSTVRLITLITLFLMLPPAITRKTTKNIKRWRYYIATILALQIGLLFTFLSFHAVILFVFPVSLIAHYGDEKLKNYTINATTLAMFVSHLLSVKCSIIFDDPFINSYYDMVVYGFIPRFICYYGYIGLVDFLTKRNAESLNNAVKVAIELHQSQESLIRQFSSLSESKSGQTGRHIKRVSHLMETFANELGMVEESENLAIAAMMHDIGKLMIDEKIIEKPAKLTNDEFEIIKRHTIYGYKLLEFSPGTIMEMAREIALDHHERWDGTGYSGKKGEEISYYARMMSIIDVFDALTSVRSYKPAWSFEKAYDEIVNQSGKQFDPDLVETFKNVYPKLKEIIENLPDDESDSDFFIDNMNFNI